MIVIRTIDLTKKFGEKIAVDSLNLEIESGEIYGFLGPNGAGKTTTIKMLTGVLRPTSGKIEILGMRYEDNEIEIKRRIGVVPDEPNVYPFFRGWEYLEFIKEIYGCDKTVDGRLSELLDAFGIDYLDTYVGDMSHGMKQKLVLASVLMRDPEVLFLDEPTVGLDPKSAKILKLYLRKLADKGRTIFMTTHILEIAQNMCTRIGIIDRGRLIAQGTIDELRKMVGEDKSLEDLFLSLTGQDEEIKRIVEELGG